MPVIRAIAVAMDREGSFKMQRQIFQKTDYDKPYLVQLARKDHSNACSGKTKLNMRNRLRATRGLIMCGGLRTFFAMFRTSPPIGLIPTCGLRSFEHVVDGTPDLLV